MADYELRPSTPDEVREMSPGITFKAVRSLSIHWRGQFAGIAGVLIRDDALVVFCDIKKGLNAPKITGVRVARALMPFLTKFKAPLYAIPQHDIALSAKLLKHLGWKELDGGIFKWQP